MRLKNFYAKPQNFKKMFSIVDKIFNIFLTIFKGNFKIRFIFY